MKIRNLVGSLILLMGVVAFPFAAHADSFGIGIAVGFAPPPLPLYVQPPCPEPGYVWTPGYWSYDEDVDDYYWVPGTWVYAPAPGLLWTPGYWSEGDEDEYVWHSGYWAPDVGFYGGINYGYGYFGVGFVGGYWRDRDFYYNRAVANVVNLHVTNIYVNNEVDRYRYGEERTSFNGREGMHARPTEPELRAQREPHRGWTMRQQSHAWQARSTPGLLASANHGRPPVAATERPGVFAGRGIVAARPSTAALPDTYRGYRNSGGRVPRFAAPSDNARAPGVPARTDRPSWAVPGSGAGPDVHRTFPQPTQAEPAPSERHDSRMYPPAGVSGAPPNTYHATTPPSYPNAARPPATPWSPPNESQPRYGGRPNVENRPNVEPWHASGAAPGRTYAAERSSATAPPPPPPQPRSVEPHVPQHAPQAYPAPGPHAPEAHPPPEHARRDDSRHDDRQR